MYMYLPVKGIWAWHCSVKFAIYKKYIFIIIIIIIIINQTGHDADK